MTTEQKVTSRELSEKFREAGAKQESEYVWAYVEDHDKWYLLHKCNAPEKCYEGYIHAFDCAELWERLQSRRTSLTVSKNQKDRFHAFDWQEDDGDACGKTPAEALGKLYLWCLENGHIE